MSIIKNKLVKKFSTIPNAIVVDTEVTPIALRAYLYLISKPDGWQVLNKDVMQKIGIKDEQTLSNAWKCLINTGWITRERELNDKGQFTGGYNYALNEYAIPENTLIRENPGSGENPTRENPRLGKNPDYNNTDMNNIYKKTDISNRENSVTDLSIQREEEERQRGLKRVQQSAFSGWEQQAKTMGIKFTQNEWDKIYAYVIAKPFLPPHEIKVALISLDKWANEGLDIEDALLTCQKYKSLQKPAAKWILDKNNIRQYGHAVIDHRKRVIRDEEAYAKENPATSV